MHRVAIYVLAGLALSSSALALVATVAIPPGASNTPGGIAVDADGNLYTADFGGTQLFKIAPSGEISVFATGFLTPSGNAFNAAGNLYQSNYQDPANTGAADAIIKVTAQGKTSVYASGLVGPVGIAVADDGVLFVDMCNVNQIWRVETDGSSAPFSIGNLYNCPNGITFDDTGDLYVVNFNDPNVIRIPPSGSEEVFATTPGTGNGHVVYIAGSLFVTSRTLHRVYEVDLTSGKVTEFAGTGVAGTVDGSNSTAQIRSPNGIARNREGTAIFINEFGGVVRRIDLDLKAPKKPKRLRAGDVTATTVQLSWKHSDRREETFVVEARAGKGDFEVAQTLPWNSTATTVSGLIPGTKYQFRVTAHNGTSASRSSNRARATTGE